MLHSSHHPSLLHPGKLTWNQLEVKMSFLFKGLIFRFHFHFRGCTYWDFKGMSGCLWIFKMPLSLTGGRGLALALRMAFHNPGYSAPTNFNFNNRVWEFQNCQYYIPWKLFKLFLLTPSSQIGNPRLSYISGRDGEEWANLDEKNAMIRNQWPGIVKDCWNCQS